jgi:hypothetical protein
VEKGEWGIGESKIELTTKDVHAGDQLYEEIEARYDDRRGDETEMARRGLGPTKVEGTSCGPNLCIGRDAAEDEGRRHHVEDAASSELVLSY